MSQDAAGRSRSASARASGGGTQEGRGLRTGVIPQEMVDRIADRVYAMLLSEMKIEAERGRSSLREPFAERGGW